MTDQPKDTATGTSAAASSATPGAAQTQSPPPAPEVTQSQTQSLEPEAAPVPESAPAPEAASAPAAEAASAPAPEAASAPAIGAVQAATEAQSPPPAPALQPELAPIEADPNFGEGSDDPFDDADSALGAENESSTASLSSSILDYRTLHGRTYHSLRGNADYWGPNDERANEAIDLTHHTLTLLFEDQLYLAPIKDPKRALDVGCGSGIWAIDFADQFPECEVVGTDISPTQPLWVPPNLQFEMDDCTQEWTYPPNSFDFIHLRYLFGSIPDWDSLLEHAYRTVEPGAWVESVEAGMWLTSDDGTVTPDSALAEWGKLFTEAGRKNGRNMNVVAEGTVGKAFRNAGFVDVVDRQFKCPLNPWANDRRLKEVGMYAKLAMEEGIEGFALYLFTTILGWTRPQVTLFLARLRKELNDKSIRSYFHVGVVYGRKPHDA